MSDTSVIRQDYDSERPTFVRRGQDATKVSCPDCGIIHWIGDCGERCARRYSGSPPNECGLLEHLHPRGVTPPHAFARPVCTCQIGSNAGHGSCPRHHDWPERLEAIRAAMRGRAPLAEWTGALNHIPPITRGDCPVCSHELRGTHTANRETGNVDCDVQDCGCVNFRVGP